MRFIDLTGKSIGRWFIVSRAENNAAGKTRWFCRCSCGTERMIVTGVLRDKRSQSCGCLKIDAAIKHGHSETRLGKPASRTYNTWKGILNRCIRPNNSKYLRYRDLGITVCDRWMIFANFLEDMGERPPGTTIDRIDSNGNYEPGNCRWATPKQQARNTRRNWMITYSGQIKSLAEWAEIHSLPYRVVYSRLRLKWSIEKALTTPVRR